MNPYVRAAEKHPKVKTQALERKAKRKADKDKKPKKPKKTK